MEERLGWTEEEILEMDLDWLEQFREVEQILNEK
jgi:hypothetical protein